MQIPEQLKSDVPQTVWGRILTATPVVMAVVATMLAGLASSEMTRAQYDRSLGAQQQSKAGDQWSFFQAKRLRGAFQHNTADLLQNISEIRPFNAAALRSAAGQLAEPLKADLLALLDSPAGRPALDLLEKGELPRLGAEPVPDAKVKAALAGLENLSADPEMVTLLAPVDNPSLEAALRAARDHAQALDTATAPVNQAIDRLDTLLSRQAEGGLGGATPALRRDFTAARLRYAALRYEREARLNQAIANLYELQVRKSNLSAERHHGRSQRFFIGMLSAQLGVIISTFAIAARKRNLLWSLAAGAGLLAIAFAVYVYLCV